MAHKLLINGLYIGVVTQLLSHNPVRIKGE